jgi:hypothetical protein
MIRNRLRAALLTLVLPVVGLAQGPSRLVADTLSHDFGQVRPDDKISHRFKVTNTGDSPMALVRVNAACGCTTTVVGKTLLAPGEGTELLATLGVAGMKGPVVKTFDLVTDDPGQKPLTFTLAADVLPDYEIATARADFLDLARADRRKASLKVKSLTGRPMYVVDAELSDAPWLGVGTRTVGNDLFLDLNLVARNIPPGKTSGTDTITLHVQNPRPATLQFLVGWSVQLPVVVSPERLAWNEDAGSLHQAELTVNGRGNRAVRILSARTTNPFLAVQGLSPKAQARHKLVVTLDAKAPAGTYDEKVLLTLDAPGKPEVGIRVTAVLR